MGLLKWLAILCSFVQPRPSVAPPARHSYLPPISSVQDRALGEQQSEVWRPLHSGYVKVNSRRNSSLYYAYWEAQELLQDGPLDTTPVILWLEVMDAENGVPPNTHNNSSTMRLAMCFRGPPCREHTPL